MSDSKPIPELKFCVQGRVVFCQLMDSGNILEPRSIVKAYGFGHTYPEALRDLAKELEAKGIFISPLEKETT